MLVGFGRAVCSAAAWASPTKRKAGWHPARPALVIPAFRIAGRSTDAETVLLHTYGEREKIDFKTSQASQKRLATGRSGGATKTTPRPPQARGCARGCRSGAGSWSRSGSAPVLQAKHQAWVFKQRLIIYNTEDRDF
jgi:hypothetical protein